MRCLVFAGKFRTSHGSVGEVARLKRGLAHVSVGQIGPNEIDMVEV